MSENENKEELEKKDEEATNTVAEEKVEEKVEQAEEPEHKEEVQKDSEEYYDDINYQEKASVEQTKEKARGIVREIFDWVLCFFIAYIIYLNINYFLISAPGVRQNSMHPTVQNGERVLVIRPWLALNKYEYGDIVTFEAPIDNKLYIDAVDNKAIAQYENYTGLTAFLHEFLDYKKVNYIKRVIGLPGDTIEIKDGYVYRNNEKLVETYTRTGITTPQEPEYAKVVVPENCMYVMGDNRAESSDSRSFGCIPFDRVNGKVVCRIWPLNKLGAIEEEK